MSASISFDRKAGAYCSSPRLRSQLVMSIDIAATNRGGSANGDPALQRRLVQYCKSSRTAWRTPCPLLSAIGSIAQKTSGLKRTNRWQKLGGAAVCRFPAPNIAPACTSVKQRRPWEPNEGKWPYCRPRSPAHERKVKRSYDSPRNVPGQQGQGQSLRRRRRSTRPTSAACCG
jgi:hypothetical protein